ncbi:SDR family oxidoreductase [Amycolatopsis sp. NPDC049691]|uniref:SDR family oxidoreductase n=1 Tax=Amycolatopsis sp. NPDC049691 TaxID=3155155 RepID=UPI00342B13C6
MTALEGRVAVVTGVSRRAGIGFAVAAELLAAGASVLAHSWSPHDAEQPWGKDPVGDAGIVEHLGGERPRERAAGSGVRRRPRRRPPRRADHPVPLRAAPGADDPDLAERVGRALPAGRWCRPDEVARLVRWLASDESRWITGQVVNAEGGFRRWVM